MPEGYTHIRTARTAARLAHLTVQYPEVFAAGANGPDFLFGYQAWRKADTRTPNLPNLGARMHEASTGAFLFALLSEAKTPAQWEYALGFLSHYAADCVIHPYVMAVTQKGELYAGPGGHGLFEIALDSLLHAQDVGDGLVPPNDAAPALSGSPLMEVCALLRPCLVRVYGAEVSPDCLMEAFDHTRTLRGLFATRNPLRRGLLRVVQPFVGGQNCIFAHVSPARLRGADPNQKQRLPTQWTNQYAGTTRDADIFVLLNEAERRSAALMSAACAWRAGELTDAGLQEELGSNSYLTGTPTAKSTRPGPEVE